jgi:hypothetical protein
MLTRQCRQKNRRTAIRSTAALIIEVTYRK